MISLKKRATMMIAALAACSLGFAQNVQVQVDGNALTFPDTQPQLVGTVVMVPLRSVFEHAGATVTWDQATQTVTSDVNGSHVVLHTGDSEATVNGNMKYLDLPPTTIGNRMLVPMRFLGDALGAQVNWSPATYTVTINTSSAYTPPPTPTINVSLQKDEVIPVTLDQTLSSTDNHVGDTFMATVSANGSEGYATLPAGTKIEGHIAAVQPQTGDEPAVLDLAFDMIDFPNGTTMPIDGSLVSMDTQYAMQGDDGVYLARDEGITYNRMVFVGFGTTDGQLVGTNESRPLMGSALDDSLSSIQAQLPEDQYQKSEIVLGAGTDMGIRINQEDHATL